MTSFRIILSAMALHSIEGYAPPSADSSRRLFGSRTSGLRLGSREPQQGLPRQLLCARKGITLPLLDFVEGSEVADDVIVPLPSAHLPDELTTLNLYGMELSRPVHKMLISEAIQKGTDPDDISGDGGSKERAYGHVVFKPDSQSLVGAVGCAAEVLIQAGRRDELGASELGMDATIAVLYRGCYRFVVRDVIKTIPYPVAIVDELVDTDDGEEGFKISTPTEEIDDEEEDNDISTFAHLTANELTQRIMEGTSTLIDQNLKLSKDQTPLEKSLLETATVLVADQASQAEEAAAVFSVFSSSLLDIAPTQLERNYAVAMMGAEIASVSNEIRAKLLTLTDSVARLRLVCQAVQKQVSLNQARSVADEVTGVSEQDLQVGTPQLPPWASQIRKGTRVEYYWNDEWDWSPGEVVEEPMKIMDEYLIQVKFDADGEIYKLPLNPDEKVRWRPGRPRKDY